MPFGLQPIHLVFIFVVALLIFGPLPEIGRGVGKAINEFRKGTAEMTEGLREEITRPLDSQTAAAPGNTMAPPTYASPVGGPAAAPGAPMAAAPTVAATGNFCTNCGAANPAEARFCNKCGTQLAA
jgi:TatA/E family protein of Tat protein translocase